MTGKSGNAAARADYRSGHRDRLRQKFLEYKITDSELLELLLTYALPRIDVKPITHDLLHQFGNIHKIITAPMAELCKVRGIKEKTAVFLKAVYEIMILDYKNYLEETPLFHDQKRLENYCRLSLLDKKQEEFHVLYVRSDFRLIADDTHSIGTVNNVSVYPREILRRALDTNAKSVVLIHNHPDGNRNFSEADIEITMEVKKILGVAGIDVLDHLLLAGDLVFSAKNMLLYK